MSTRQSGLVVWPAIIIWAPTKGGTELADVAVNKSSVVVLSPLSARFLYISSSIAAVGDCFPLQETQRLFGAAGGTVVVSSARLIVYTESESFPVLEIPLVR